MHKRTLIEPKRQEDTGSDPNMMTNIQTEGRLRNTLNISTCQQNKSHQSPPVRLFRQ